MWLESSYNMRGCEGIYKSLLYLEVIITKLLLFAQVLCTLEHILTTMNYTIHTHADQHILTHAHWWSSLFCDLVYLWKELSEHQQKGFMNRWKEGGLQLTLRLCLSADHLRDLNRQEFPKTVPFEESNETVTAKKDV